MPADTVVEPPQSALTGVARVLVHAGTLTQKAAEEISKAARDRRTSFVASALSAGAVKPAELAHVLARALALPLVDLHAVDLARAPRNILDAKLSQQYQVVVLGRRGSRLFIGAADPTSQEAAERIKFATQLTPEWIVVEHDKLQKLIDTTTASAGQVLDTIIGEDFDFEASDAPEEAAWVLPRDFVALPVTLAPQGLAVTDERFDAQSARWMRAAHPVALAVGR